MEYLEWLTNINPLDTNNWFPPLENALSSIPVIGDPFKDDHKFAIGQIINWKTGLIVGGLVYAWIRYRGGEN